MSTKENTEKKAICNNPECVLYGIHIDVNESSYFDPILEKFVPIGDACPKCNTPFIHKR